MAESFERALSLCSDEESCRRAAEELLRGLCPDAALCSGQKVASSRNYDWIELLLKKGVPDGRRRLILYVVSRYLVNVKGLSEEDAIAEVKDFLRKSCENYNNCSKVYDSWIRNVINRVKSGGWKPWTLEKLKEKDPQLYSAVSDVALKGSEV